MEKVLLGTMLLSTLFFGTELKKEQECKKYLDKADKYIDYAEKKVNDRVENDDSYLGGIDEGMKISTLSIALMKRYEICLNQMQ